MAGRVEVVADGRVHSVVLRLHAVQQGEEVAQRVRGSERGGGGGVGGAAEFGAGTEVRGHRMVAVELAACGGGGGGAAVVVAMVGRWWVQGYRDSGTEGRRDVGVEGQWNRGTGGGGTAVDGE